MHQPSAAHAAGGAPHAQPPPPPLATPTNTGARYVCDGCGQTFDRKFNLDRHKQRKVPCTQKLDTAGQHAAARLLCTVLDVLRGPLNLSEQQAKDDALVTRILADLWAAVALAADKYPERAYGLVHRLVVEQLNARQVTLLFSVVLVAHHPPTQAMIQTLRALYAQLYHQQEAVQQQQGGTATRQRLASKLQGMWLLEALR